MPARLRRARRSAAVARGTLAISGALIALADAPVTHRHPPHHPVPVLIGFAIIFATALIQLIAPRAEWIKIEESLAPVSAILIVGLGPERITTPWLGRPGDVAGLAGAPDRAPRPDHPDTGIVGRA
ncbi:MAG TPA: hypothetical protein VHW96_13695 [Solirubrobacteraceae bacterium]|jgi:hypothetical protein|nr:hypothetical protein [Solirubrobacteraceae bacterium]